MHRFWEPVGVPAEGYEDKFEEKDFESSSTENEDLLELTNNEILTNE